MELNFRHMIRYEMFYTAYEKNIDNWFLYPDRGLFQNSSHLATKNATPLPE